MNTKSIIFKITDSLIPMGIFLFLLSEFDDIYWNNIYFIILPLCLLLNLVFSYLQGIYSDLTSQNLYEVFIFFFKIWLGIGALLIAISFLLNSTQLAATVILCWIIFSPILMVAYRKIIKNFSKKDINLICLGDFYKFTEYENTILAKQKIKLHFLSLENIDEIASKIKTLAKQHDTNKVILNTKLSSSQLIKDLTYQNVDGFNFYSIENFMEYYLRKLYIPNEQANFNYLESIKHFSAYQKILKFIIDVCGIIILGTLMVPLTLIIFPIIVLQSPGNIFYKQARVGLNQIEFICHKFRTMINNAESSGAKFANANDSRLLKFGNFIRKMRIDELPQILNIIKGEMHLIGPRPERKIWTDKFEQEIPYYAQRHLSKPGITGWAQVNYPYGSNAEDAKQKLMYDLYYLKNWNLALELETIILTIKTIFFLKGL